MQHPRSTGLAARLLNSTEPALAELVRRGKVDPPPMVVAGRRLWYPDHLLQAAQELGCLTDELRQQLEREAEVASHV